MKRREHRDERYSAGTWRAERSDLHRGRPPLPCPKCQRTGFYAARDDHPLEGGKPYRACCFCGFWQEVGKEPVAAAKLECHGYSVIRPPGAAWVCPTCGKKPDAGSAKPWPVDDKMHRWWDVPQNLSQDEYLAYWRLEWGHDASPFGIVWLD